MDAKPHVRERASYTPEEFRSYHEGYTWALVIALRVFDLADEQHAIMARYRRRIAQRGRREREGQRKSA